MSAKSVLLWRRAIILMVVAALLINTMPVLPAHAQSDNVTMSVEKWGNTVWTADWLQRHQGVDRVQDTLATMWLLKLYEKAPAMSQEEGVQEMNAFLAKFQEQIDDGQSEWELATQTIAEQGLLGAKAIAGFADDGNEPPALSETIEWVDGMVWQYAQSVDHETAYHKGYEITQAVNGHEEDIQAQAIDVAKNNENFAAVYNATFEPPVDIEKAKDDFVLGPLVAPIVKDRIVFEPDGTITIAFDALEEEVGNQSNQIDDVINSQLQVAHQINALQTDFQKYMKNPQAQEQAKQLEEATKQADQLKIKAAQSGVFIVSTLISLKDPKLGKKVAIAGNAGVTIAQSIFNYVDTMAKLGKLLNKDAGGTILGLASKLGAVVMTGDILGAVMNIISLFQDSGPSDTQLILQQVGQMRQQLQDIHKEMDQRFDRVDKELNTIYNNMMTQFTLINLSEWQMRNDINNIQTKLLDMEMSLHAVELEMNEWAADSANSHLYESVNYIVGYKDRFPEPITGSTYYGLENTFFHWATQEASNSINAGGYDLGGDEYTDTERELTHLSHPMDQQINYLDGWLLAHGIQPFADQRLANPQIWALSTRTYAQVKYDWPQYAIVHDPNHLELTQIRQVGLDLSNAIKGITTVQTAQGPRGNRALFDGVGGYYTGTVGTLDSALKSVEDTYIHNLMASTLIHDPNVLDFWGAANQPINYAPSGMWCPDAGVDMPSTTNSWIPPLYLVRNYLTPGADRDTGHSKILTCWGADWVNTRQEQREQGITAYVGQLEVTVDVYYEGVNVASQSVRSPEEQYGLCGQNPDEGSCHMNEPEDVAKKNWKSGRNYKSLLESTAQPTPMVAGDQQARDAKQNQVTAQVNQILQGYQLGIYQAMVTALGDPTLQQAAARTLEANREVLTSLIELGMPRALTTDEYLRAFLNGDSLVTDQRLFDDEMVTNWYSAAYLSLLKSQGQSVTADQQVMVDRFQRNYGDQPLTTNPRIVLGQAINSRAALLRQQLEQYFELVDQGVYKDSEPLIEMTLQQLDLFDTVGRMARSQPTPTTTPATPTATPIIPPTTPTAPVPGSTATPAPQPSGTPVTDPSGTPSPVPSATPISDPSETPAPVPSGTPSPVPSGTPAPLPSTTPAPTSDPSNPSDPSASSWIEPASGGQVTGNVGMGISLNFPPGAYAQPIVVKLKVIEQPPTTAGHSLVGQVFAIEAFDSKQQAVTHFDKPYTLTLHYADIAGIHEDRLQLYYWKDGQWIAVPTEVDSGANTLTATLDHMTIFSTFANEIRLFMPVVQR